MKRIIALVAAGLIILLVGVWLLVGFCVPPAPDSYTLTTYLGMPRHHEGPFDITQPFKVGDKIQITVYLLTRNKFFYQKILYADNGPIYCTVTIETDQGTEKQEIKLLGIVDYDEMGVIDRDIESVPYTTIEIERFHDAYINHSYGTTRYNDYEFTKPGIYTFECYAAFQQIGRNFYIEQSPDPNPAATLMVVVTE